MLDTPRRILAYLLDDAKKAEGLKAPQLGETPAWIAEAAEDDDLAQQAVNVAAKSQEMAESAVKSLQDKASSHVTLLLALVPFALGATLLTLPPDGVVPLARLVAFVLLAAADLCLVAALVMCTLAAGLVLAGGISLDRLGILAHKIAPTAPAKSAIRAAEAEALRYATLLSYASGVRVGQDLYTGRRLMVFAVLLASLGILVLVAFGGGIDVFRAPAPKP